MKFVYYFKTSDGVKHRGVYSAHERAAVYDELKKKGIRPFGVVAAPGFFNRLRGLGFRWMVIIILAITSLAAVSALLLARKGSVPYVEALTSTSRRQIIGDSAIIEDGVATGWRAVFDKEGDRFLASYAIPGVIGGTVTSTVGAVESVMSSDPVVSNGDAMEARQVKLIVAGMKDELRTFVSDGGSVRQYCKLMVRRQLEEIEHYRRAETEIKSAIARKESEARVKMLWARLNENLRKMGMKTVPRPDFEGSKKSKNTPLR